jgi:glycerophosphoryl diester phosphodiesterase
MILYGHRGAKGEAPENTLLGFEYGLRLGLRAFELDVRLTADQEIVVLHDAMVDRTTNGAGPVSELTREQIQRLDARADFPDWPTPCRIPTLDEVFSLLPSETVLEIEIKRDEPERLAILVPKLIALIDRYDASERVTISSFDNHALRLMRDAAPVLPRAFIGAYDQPEFLRTAMELECVQADIPLTTGSHDAVHEAHERGLRVTGWPGDTIEQLRTLLKWQVEGIATNFPSLALSFLREPQADDNNALPKDKER